MSPGSVGIVCPQAATFLAPLPLDSGDVLPQYTLEYEAYGSMSPSRDNVILVCHGLTGNAHAAGVHTADDLRAGWWDVAIGPGKMLDTSRYCVLCSTVLGGNGQSTAPASVNPETGDPYGSQFPTISIADMVRAQVRLVESLGIGSLYAVVGGCMGASQALLWGLIEPTRAPKVLAITVRASASPASLAMWEVVRQAIFRDPAWRNGDYYNGEIPRSGLGLAKMIALLHLVDDQHMGAKYGRGRLERSVGVTRFSPEFLVEHMIDRVGSGQQTSIDPNSLVYLTKAISNFDIESQFGSIDSAFSRGKQSYLFVSYLRDRRYPPQETAILANAARRAGLAVNHLQIEHEISHGAYQYDVSALESPVKKFLNSK